MELPGGDLFCGIRKVAAGILPGSWNAYCDNVTDPEKEREREIWLEDHNKKLREAHLEFLKLRRQYLWNATYSHAEPLVIASLGQAEGADRSRLQRFHDLYWHLSVTRNTALRYQDEDLSKIVQVVFKHVDSGEPVTDIFDQLGRVTIKEESDRKLPSTLVVIPAPFDYNIHLGYTYGLISTIIIRTRHADTYDFWLNNPEARFTRWREGPPRLSTVLRGVEHEVNTVSADFDGDGMFQTAP